MERTTGRTAEHQLCASALEALRPKDALKSRKKDFFIRNSQDFVKDVAHFLPSVFEDFCSKSLFKEFAQILFNDSLL